MAGFPYRAPGCICWAGNSNDLGTGLFRSAREIMSSMMVEKIPNTADTPAASSSPAIPKNAGIIITQKMNHRAVKIKPFFLENHGVFTF